MNKRKVSECARPNKKGKANFIPSPLLEILSVQMLGSKIKGDHYRDGAKEKILSGKLGSNELISSIALDIQASICTLQVEMERSLIWSQRKNCLGSLQFGAIQSCMQLFKNIYQALSY